MEKNNLQGIILKDFIDNLEQTDNMQETTRYIKWKYQDYQGYELKEYDRVIMKLRKYLNGK